MGRIHSRIRNVDSVVDSRKLRVEGLEVVAKAVMGEAFTASSARMMVAVELSIHLTKNRVKHLLVDLDILEEEGNRGYNHKENAVFLCNDYLSTFSTFEH